TVVPFRRAKPRIRMQNGVVVEEWRRPAGTYEIEVSNLGRVRSIVTGKIKQIGKNNGSAFVSDMKKVGFGYVTHNVNLARAIAQTFEVSGSGDWLHFLDHDRFNLAIWNLVWIEENDSRRHRSDIRPYRSRKAKEV